MKKKYKQFAEKFEILCEEFKDEDFDAQEIINVCTDIVNDYSQ